MLSLFPTLFDYSAVATVVLRVVVAVIFIMEGYKKLPKKSVPMVEGITEPKKPFVQTFMPVIEFIGGLFFFVGLFTQLVAVILAAISMKKMCVEYKHKSAQNHDFLFFLLLFFITLSFLFFGPGLRSIDYPL